MRFLRLVGLGVATGLLLFTGAAASAGSWGLDPSFSDDGKLRLGDVVRGGVQEIGVANDLVYAAGIQSEGPGFKVFVVRTLADGTIDSSFGDQGVARGGAPVNYATGFELEVLSDGSSVVSYQTKTEAVVFRWTSDGALDTSFSGDGRRMIEVASRRSANTGAAVDSLGRVVVGVLADSKDGANTRIYRMLPSGALDATFSGDGSRAIDLYDADWVDDVAVDAQDRVLITLDDARGTEPGRSHLVRLKSNGAFDQSFSGDGLVRFALPGGADDFSYPIGLGVDPDGVITVALHGGSHRFGVARIRADGRLDHGYGVEGVAGYLCNCFVTAAQVEDGRVVVAGPTLDDDQTFVATISKSGDRIVQGLIGLGNRFPRTVAFAGSGILISGNVGGTSFIWKLQ